MLAYEIVLPEGDFGPFLPSTEAAVDWARANLAPSQTSATYPLAMRDGERTTVIGEVVVGRTGTFRSVERDDP